MIKPTNSVSRANHSIHQSFEKTQIDLKEKASYCPIKETVKSEDRTQAFHVAIECFNHSAIAFQAIITPYFISKKYPFASNSFFLLFFCNKFLLFEFVSRDLDFLQNFASAQSFNISKSVAEMREQARTHNFFWNQPLAAEAGFLKCTLECD